MEEIFVPALGVTAETVYLKKWLKSSGDSVSAGEVVAIVETDKAELEITANATGVMGKQRFEEDSDIPVGETICIIVGPGEKESSI
jgi:pyruvate/2-oxoglutarate dehydrogenase complex dihydrolipoamide acyltransferase (E2) component